MHRVLSCLISVFFFGCAPAIEKADLEQLNGYWEIMEVEFKNGQKKEYAISTTIDYIQFDEMKGFRKKVQPQLRGTYQTSDDATSFEVIEKEGSFHFSYVEGTQKWEEALITLDKNSFAVKNQDDVVYTYKRYEPFDLKP